MAETLLAKTTQEESKTTFSSYKSKSNDVDDDNLTFSGVAKASSDLGEQDQAAMEVQSHQNNCRIF